MLKHRSKGRSPQLTFTADFHELVQGDLQPGPCVLRYDPWRIVPESEILDLPASQRAVRAHINFHPLAESWTGELRLRPGTALELAPDPTGHGTMLGVEFPLPTGCQELELWFSYTDATGQVFWDSAHGANFWLRFPTHDLTVARAEVLPSADASAGQLVVEVQSVPEVDAIELRWRLTQFPTVARQRAALLAVAAADGAKTWSTPAGGLSVPPGAVVAFDLVYYVNSHKFTDDNQGTWFLT